MAQQPNTTSNSYNFNDIADAISKAKKRISKKRPRPYNAFREWGMKENDHTKLLLSFLRYTNTKEQYRVLRKFLERFTKGRGAMIHYKVPDDVQILFSPKYDKDFIDGLIILTKNRQKYAVIIENKIYDAPDQKDQIRRYIKHVKDKEKIELNSIWVLYLTSDNNKVIGKNSYKLEGEVPDTNIGNRFIQLTYSEDIINWLKEDILSLRIYPETLTSSVRTYVDYLEDMFVNADEFDMNLADELCKQLVNKTVKEINSTNDIDKLYDFQKALRSYQKKANNEAIDELDTVTRFAVKQLENRAFKRFEETTANILNERWKKELKKDNLVWKVAHRGSSKDWGFIQIRLTDDWGTVHMEWAGMNTQKMLCETKYNIKFHVERNRPLAKEYIEQVEKLTFPTFQCGKKVSRGGSTCIFNFNVSRAQKTFAQMTDDNLTDFLKKLYTEDLDSLFELMINRIEDYKDINTYNKTGTT